MSRPRGYDELKTLAAGIYKPVKDLIVMSQDNDPFYCGSKAQKKHAEWFYSLWKLHGFTYGTHLRRVHYLLVSQEQPVIKPDGYQ